MSSKQNIGKIIKEQRKSIPLTQKQICEMSGISIAHLVRIESGERIPSPHTLQQIARPLGLDLSELFIMGGYLSPEPSALSKEQRDKLLAELNMLLERLVSDRYRIREIVNRLLTTS